MKVGGTTNKLTVPTQRVSGELPQGHGTVTRPCEQEGRVARQCACSEWTTARMLQHGRDLAGIGATHYDGAIRGAADQVAAAGAEAATVDPVAVTTQGRVGELREVIRPVDTDGLVAGGGCQQTR